MISFLVIRERYEALEIARRRLFDAGEVEIDRREQLAARRAEAVSGGLIVGKNESERDACARQLLAQQYADVNSAEFDARAVRCSYEIAGLRVEEARMELRLLEVADTWQDHQVAKEE